MRHSLIILCGLAWWCSANAQTHDTLVAVGNYELAFHVTKGKGTPILFESGGGNDGTIWNNLIPPLAEITGATLITYDRAGFGKSGLDTNRHGVMPGVIDLEMALKKLGYARDLMLVAHLTAQILNW